MDSSLSFDHNYPPVSSKNAAGKFHGEHSPLPSTPRVWLLRKFTSIPHLPWIFPTEKLHLWGFSSHEALAVAWSVLEWTETSLHHVDRWSSLGLETSTSGTVEHMGKDMKRWLKMWEMMGKDGWTDGKWWENDEILGASTLAEKAILSMSMVSKSLNNWLQKHISWDVRHEFRKRMVGWCGKMNRFSVQRVQRGPNGQTVTKRSDGHRPRALGQGLAYQLYPSCLKCPKKWWWENHDPHKPS